MENIKMAAQSPYLALSFVVISYKPLQQAYKITYEILGVNQCKYGEGMKF
jgi:hypothetical protein